MSTVRSDEKVENKNTVCVWHVVAFFIYFHFFVLLNIAINQHFQALYGRLDLIWLKRFTFTSIFFLFDVRWKIYFSSFSLSSSLPFSPQLASRFRMRISFCVCEKCFKSFLKLISRLFICWPGKACSSRRTIYAFEFELKENKFLNKKFQEMTQTVLYFLFLRILWITRTL